MLNWHLEQASGTDYGTQRGAFRRRYAWQLMEGAVVVAGLNALGAGLYSIGIPKDSILQYQPAIKADKFLLVVHGRATEIAKAKDILNTMQPTELAEHVLEAAKGAATS